MSRVVLITGASRGIGEALAEAFKKNGWTVAACARGPVSTPDVDFAFTCDVSRVDQVRGGVFEVVKRFGRIDAVVNNAGKAGTNLLSPDDNDDLWHEILDVNLNGTYYFCKHSLPHLPTDGTGRIINIASVLALKGVPDQTAYCAAKHAVLGFTRALSHYVASRRITVNAICPGWVRTDMARGRMKELGLTEQSLEAGVPLGRFIEPREVAELAIYLVSDAGAGITGQALTIDGGFLA